MPDKFDWEDRSPSLFQSALSGPQVTPLITSFINCNYDTKSVNNMAMDLNDIVIKAAELSLRKKINKT